MDLVLSLFTGAGLLDKGFQQTGFCVVSAGDILWGNDVREFVTDSHMFKGVPGKSHRLGTGFVFVAVGG